MKVKSLSLRLSDPMDCSLPGFSVHGIFQARVLEWGAIDFFTGIELLNANPSSSSRVKSTSGLWELTTVCSHRMEVSVKAELLCRRRGFGIFSSAWWLFLKGKVRCRHASVGVIVRAGD